MRPPCFRRRFVAFRLALIVMVFGATGAGAAEEIVTVPLRQFGLGYIRDVALHPGGNTAVVATACGLFVVDSTTGKVIHEIRHGDKPVVTDSHIRLSRGGGYVATFTSGRHARIWGISGGLVSELGDVYDLDFGANDAMVVCRKNTSNGVSIASVAGGGDILSSEEVTGTAVLYSADGDNLLSGDGATLKVWKIIYPPPSPYKPPPGIYHIRSMEAPPDTADTTLWKLEWSPDKSRILGCYPGRVVLWDYYPGAVFQSWDGVVPVAPPPGMVLTPGSRADYACLAPDPQDFLAFHQDKGVVYYSTYAEAPIRSFPRSNYFSAAAGGARLLLWRNWPEKYLPNWTFDLYETVEGARLNSSRDFLAHLGTAVAEVRADGGRVYLGSPYDVFGNVATNSLSAAPAGDVFSPDLTLYLDYLVAGRLRTRLTGTDVVLQDLEFPKARNLRYLFSPDNSRLIGWGTDDQVNHTSVVWDLGTGRILKEAISPEPVVQCTHTSRGPTVLRIRRYEPGMMDFIQGETGELICSARISRWAFDGNTRIFNFYREGPTRFVFFLGNEPNLPIRVWNLETCQLEASYPINWYDIANVLDLSPDGRHYSIRVAHAEGHAVSLASLPTGERIRRFDFHRDLIDYARFSQLGAHLLTVSRDGTAKLWDTGLPLVPTPVPSPTPTLTPVPTGGVTPTPTVTATPTAVISPSPTPTPPPDAFSDFRGDEEGWTTHATQAFDVPTFAHTAGVPGSLSILARNSTTTFGYWESPVTELADDGSLHTADFLIRSTVPNAARVPQLRLRTTAENLQQAGFLVVESRADGVASPGFQGGVYTLLFQPAPGGREGRYEFDFLNFDPADDPRGDLQLDWLAVARRDWEDIGPRPLLRRFEFASGREGWVERTTAVFNAPRFEAEADALVLGGNGTSVTFGYWESPAVEVVTTDTLALGFDPARVFYIARFLVESDLPEDQRHRVPQFRLRLNEASFHAASVVAVESKGDGSRSPVAGQPQEYMVYFRPPAAVATQPLIVAFDYLNFDPHDDPHAALKLHSVHIEAGRYPW